MAWRRLRAPQVIAYWLTSVSMARRAASLTSSGAAKSGKPCERLTAPWSWARRVISRITDSVKRPALSEARRLTGGTSRGRGSRSRGGGGGRGCGRGGRSLRRAGRGGSDGGGGEQCHVRGERAAEVHVSGQGLRRTVVHQDLHALDGREVHGQRVHDR